MQIALLVYVAGVAVAFWRVDAGWPTRAALALLWPLGPAAFVVTVIVLVAASLIAFPVIGATVAVATLIVVWWLVR